MNGAHLPTCTLHELNGFRNQNAFVSERQSDRRQPERALHETFVDWDLHACFSDGSDFAAELVEETMGILLL